jgi:hypothetical protein
VPKSIISYGGFSASALKSRASVPDQSDMTVNGSNVDCINISIAKVHNAVQSSCLHLYGLCTSPRVNKWSAFGPRQWELGSVLESVVRTPYSLADFAGYNHNAQPPYLVAYSNDFNFQEGQQNVQFDASLFLNEIPWMNIPFLASVNMEVYVSGIYFGTSHIEMSSSSYSTTQFIFSVSGSCVGWTSDKTATLRFYFGRNSSNSYAELCAIPNISSKTVQLTYKPKAKLRSFVNTFNKAGQGVGTISFNPGGFAADSNATNLEYYRSVNYAQQSTNEVYVYWFGLDTNSDGIGDVKTLLGIPPLYYWYKINNGTWTIAEQVFVGMGQGVLDNELNSEVITIFDTITYGDLIDIEVRS